MGIISWIISKLHVKALLLNRFNDWKSNNVRIFCVVSLCFEKQVLKSFLVWSNCGVNIVVQWYTFFQAVCERISTAAWETLERTLW